MRKCLPGMFPFEHWLKGKFDKPISKPKIELPRLWYKIMTQEISLIGFQKSHYHRPLLSLTHFATRYHV